MNKEPMTPEDIIAIARQSWVKRLVRVRAGAREVNNCPRLSPVKRRTLH